MNNSKSEYDFQSMYLHWLSENIEQFQINSDVYRVTLPFLDRNNDHTDVYVVDRHDGTFRLTDDGAILNDLSFCGCDLFSSKRRHQTLLSVVAAHGVSISDSNELETVCALDDLPQKKHMLAQCMVKVSDLFYLSKTNVKSLFLDDVKNFLWVNDIRAVPNISVTGKSKLTSNYDFVVSESKHAPERLIKVINTLSLDAARNTIFLWDDTKGVRPSGAKLFAFIQDNHRRVSSDAVRALQEYDIVPAFWTKRESIIAELAA